MGGKAGRSSHVHVKEWESEASFWLEGSRSVLVRASVRRSLMESECFRRQDLRASVKCMRAVACAA
jgi:hypothetical protein